MYHVLYQLSYTPEKQKTEQLCSSRSAFVGPRGSSLGSLYL